jgi:ribonuclease HII
MENLEILTGIDDATKCPVIGSIFVAGVVAHSTTIKTWKELGVTDSKLLSAKKRESLASVIKETALAFSIKQITPAMIDDKSLNLNQWEMITVLKIIHSLQRTAQLEKVYIDNWETSEKGFRERFDQITNTMTQTLLHEKKIKLHSQKFSSLMLIPEHRADENHVIVGAASILAKTSSDAQYRYYKKKYGDFGSGSPADPATRLFVWHHRHHPLPIIRTSWATYKTLAILDHIEDDPMGQRLKRT